MPVPPVLFTHVRSALPRRAGITLGLIAAGMPLAAADAAAAVPGPSTPDPAAAALEQLRAADRARSDLAREESAWALERARLLALIDATAAETARLERDAVAAETRRDQARSELAALGDGSQLDMVRARLAEGGERAATALTQVSRQVVPGTVPVPDAGVGEGRFDAVVRALEAGERAAAATAVEVITGQRSGTPQAVKILRIAGAAAWWVALDGTAAGTVAAGAEGIRLVDAPADQALAIATALAQAEGRQPPGIALLPTPSPAPIGARP